MIQRHAEQPAALPHGHMKNAEAPCGNKDGTMPPSSFTANGENNEQLDARRNYRRRYRHGNHWLDNSRINGMDVMTNQRKAIKDLNEAAYAALRAFNIAYAGKAGEHKIARILREITVGSDLAFDMIVKEENSERLGY